MSKLDNPAPTVRIPGGDITVQRSWTVVLSSMAAHPSAYLYNATDQSCTPTTQAASTLGFEWSVDHSGPSFEFAALPPAFKATQYSSQLAIPPNYLQVGFYHANLCYILRRPPNA